MSRGGHQKSWDGERLRSESATQRRTSTKNTDSIADLGPTFQVGQVSLFAVTAPSDEWKQCSGASYEKRDYPELFGVIGTTFGSSGTTFQVPNIPAVIGNVIYYIYAGRE